MKSMENPSETRDNPVGTEKERITTYVSAELKESIWAWADRNDKKASGAIAELLEQIATQNGKVICLSAKTWEKLAAWAAEDRRSPEQQAEWIIQEALKQRQRR
jgi:hypothetical protein